MKRDLTVYRAQREFNIYSDYMVSGSMNSTQLIVSKHKAPGLKR